MLDILLNNFINKQPFIMAQFYLTVWKQWTNTQFLTAPLLGVIVTYSLNISLSWSHVHSHAMVLSAKAVFAVVLRSQTTVSTGAMGAWFEVARVRRSKSQQKQSKQWPALWDLGCPHTNLVSLKTSAQHKGDIGTEKLDKLFKFLYILGFRRSQLYILESFDYFFSFFVFPQSDMLNQLKYSLCFVRTRSTKFLKV